MSTLVHGSVVVERRVVQHALIAHRDGMERERRAGGSATKASQRGIPTGASSSEYHHFMPRSSAHASHASSLRVARRVGRVLEAEPVALRRSTP